MFQANGILGKHSALLQIGIVLLAIWALSPDISRPFANYDEATYAKVVTDTRASGDIWSFTLSGQPWFEKPPLQLWSTMASLHVFGENEAALRIPALLFAVLCIWLTYLVAREVTGSELAGIIAALVLITAAIFIDFARELRLDQGVLASILAAFLLWLKSAKKEQYLLGVLPLAAVGFLFKSVIVCVLGVVLLVYSLFSWRWKWLTSKYLWFGLPMALLIVVPWHIVQYLRFGDAFTDRYFLFDVYKRATSVVTGDGHWFDYFFYFWYYAKIWSSVLVLTIVSFASLLFVKSMRQSDVWKPILAPLAVAFIIITVFSVAKTHLLPYILPAFPFLALFIAVLGQRVATAFKIGPYVSILIAVPFIFTGFMYNLHSYANSNLPGVPDEKEIGIAYRSQHDDIPLYTLEWPFLETLNYYGDTKVQALSAAAHSGKEIKGPFYLVTNAAGASYFYVIRYGEVVTPYDHMRLVYQGKMLALLYFDSDTVLPEFSVPR